MQAPTNRGRIAVRAIQEAGWTWRPAITFVRAFGG